MLTGMDRRTVTDRVSAIPSIPGPKNARLYESDVALKAIYRGGDGVDWREELVKQNALLAKVERESKERERIPRPVVHSAVEPVFQEMAAIIKGSGLPEAAVNDIFELCRTIPARLKW